MGYYDLDDILADSAEIPCKFLHDIPGLGYLENNPGGSIHANTQLKLPLWLARVLAIIDASTASDDVGNNDIFNSEQQFTPFLNMLTPETFTNKVINAIKTDPISLDLHSINPYFYALAIKWIELFSDKELADIVSDLLLQRSQVINAHANSITISYNDNNSNSNNTTTSNNMTNNNHTLFTLTLDEFEKKIFKEANDSYKDIKKWIYQY